MKGANWPAQYSRLVDGQLLEIYFEYFTLFIHTCRIDGARRVQIGNPYAVDWLMVSS